MTHKINMMLGLFAVTALTLGFSGIANAATYQYVSTSGVVNSVAANSPTEALAIASNLGLHSGVMLVSDTTEVINGDYVAQGQGANVYMYINTSGQVSFVSANSVQEALATAYNLGMHSGVMLK